MKVRVRAIPDGVGYENVIEPSRVGLNVAISAVMAAGWCFGAFSLYSEILRENAAGAVTPRWMLALVLLVCLLAECLLLGNFLFIVAGVQVISIMNGELISEYRIWRTVFGRRRYSLSTLSEMRIEPRRRSFKGRKSTWYAITFNCEGVRRTLTVVPSREPLGELLDAVVREMGQALGLR